MRLTCPNCKAQYEVEDSVIPEGGRDVQCSACGHTWYQYPLSTALQMRAEEIGDVMETPPPESSAAESVRAAPRRRLDRSVMDLLREEAEREIRERRGAGEGLETQGDLGLPVGPTRPGSSRARQGAEAMPGSAGTTGAAALSETAAEEAPRPVVDPPPVATAAHAPSRRNLLPDIEELSSTLEPRRDTRRSAPPTDGPDGIAPSEQRRGLLRGLSMVVIIAGVLLALYLLAPVIAEQVPALADAMAGYVALVDALRAQVAQWVTQLITAIGGGDGGGNGG